MALPFPLNYSDVYDAEMASDPSMAVIITSDIEEGEIAANNMTEREELEMAVVQSIRNWDKMVRNIINS